MMLAASTSLKDVTGGRTTGCVHDVPQMILSEQLSGQTARIQADQTVQHYATSPPR